MLINYIVINRAKMYEKLHLKSFGDGDSNIIVVLQYMTSNHIVKYNILAVIELYVGNNYDTTL